MTTVSSGIKQLYQREMTAAKHVADPQRRWTHLERAHIISQPYPWLHTRNHVAMLALAISQRDRREAAGQVVRIIVAAPGSLTGRFPEGNTGRTDAGLRTPMPVPADLATEITEAAA
ncbi:DUF3703 domain-containing protein [Nocardia sp. NBC_01730]|uniref:DUF3703 domain-containing protein n=1 Tax=Nocardia sp. NBC_01730 TaxID=2975998 RepID=UPI002E0DB6A4|nr:DUF3703 domain-containing protein [Nocardia sp. NBC_01730]